MRETASAPESSIAAITTSPELVKPRASPLWARFLDHPIGLFLGRCAFVAALLGLWQWGSGDFLPTIWFSSPVAVWRILNNWVADGSLWNHIGATGSASGIGYLFGAASGVGVGLILGFFPAADAIFRPFLTAFYCLPKIALAPLFVIMFGIGLQSKIVLVALAVFFLTLYSTLDGIRDIDRDLVQALRVMGARSVEIVRIALIPGCLPRIFTGLRISVRHAFTAAVLGEVIAGNRGIGYLIALEAGNFRASGVFAALLVLVICSVLITELLTRTEVSAIRWRI